MKVINVNTFDEFDKLYTRCLNAKQRYEQSNPKSPASVTLAPDGTALPTNEAKNDDDSLRNLIFLFTASDEPTSKESWCPDCRKIKPIIEQMIQKFQYNDQIVLAIVQVGQRDEWKSGDNPFRVHAVQLSNVPTLLSLKEVSSHHTRFYACKLTKVAASGVSECHVAFEGTESNMHRFSPIAFACA